MKNKAKFHVIIPARYLSERFIGKSITLINGKPMIAHVIESASKSDGVKEVHVATDSERIAAIALNYRANVIMTSSKHVCGTDRVCEAANFLKIPDNEIVVNVQADQPFFGPKLIESLIKPLINTAGWAMSTLRYPNPTSDPDCVKVVIAADGSALYFSRASMSGAYKHIGMYAYSVSFLRYFNFMPQSKLEKAEGLEQLRALENNARIMTVLSPEAVVSINKREDMLYLK